jgi:hypothetical protein
VVQAENKLERQKRACASKVSKLEVRRLLSLFAIFYVDVYIFSQARNVTLLRNEREAYETVRCNTISMIKVAASHHTLLLTFTQTVNPNPNHPPTGSEGARRSKTIFERRDYVDAKSREVAHLAY